MDTLIYLAIAIILGLLLFAILLFIFWQKENAPGER